MYGTIKTPNEFDEYVSLNQLDEIEDKPSHSCCNYTFVKIILVGIFLVILYVGFHVFLIKN
jgi:hypothetical protein